ncbi:MAG: glycosyltransferase family 2 protein [Patescibacteria group bacterium]
MKLSVIIPAHNEEDCIEKTVLDISEELKKESIDNEIIIVNDNSTDRTVSIINNLAQEYNDIRLINRQSPNGFGRAVREGLDNATGDVIIIAMGDASDDPRDIVKYFYKIEEGYDCVFGSRFIKGAMTRDYPFHKLIVNRIANTFLRILFLTKHNDLTNAFKAYRREVIDAIKPIESLYFNITIELPLKALIRGYSIASMPTNWYGRKSGVSKLKIKEMGRRYLYTTLYLWLQKTLIRDDIRDKRK